MQRSGLSRSQQDVDIGRGAFLRVVPRASDLDLPLSLNLPRLCISSPGTALLCLSVPALRWDG